MKNIQNIKESISVILDSGGKVSHSYKETLRDWVGEITIYYFHGMYDIPAKYCVHGGPFKEFTDKNEAINYYINYVFGPNNLWYCLERIREKLNINDWENQNEYNFENPHPKFLILIEKEKLLIQNELNENN